MTIKFNTPRVITLHSKFPVPVGDSFEFDAYLYSDPQLERPLPLGVGTLTVNVTDDKQKPSYSTSKTVGDGITVVDADLGHVRVRFTPTDTNSLGDYGGTLYFEMKYEDDDGNPYTVATGSLALTPVAP